MCTDYVRPFRKFCADRRGNFAMMFAMAAPVLAIAMAAALDYSNAVELNQRAQAAADSAALAATEAMVTSIKNGTQLTAAQATTVATNYFNGNAPLSITSAQTAFSSSTTVSSGNVVTTKVSYNGTPATVIGGIVGSAMSVSISATSSATLASTPVGTATGTGWVDEDPVVQGANGQYWFMDTCDYTHATWYNLLSDTNIEVNANCDGNVYWSELYQFTVLAGTHTVSVTPGINPELWSTNPNVYADQEQWAGAVTVDGTSYSAPTKATTTTYINDTSEGVTVELVVGQPGTWGSSANYLLITTAAYSMTIAYDSDDDGSYNLGFSAINISATNAGACGTPGGVWGQTLVATGVDSNFSDFAVATSTTKTSQFSKTCATTATNTILTQ